MLFKSLNLSKVLYFIERNEYNVIEEKINVVLSCKKEVVFTLEDKKYGVKKTIGVKSFSYLQGILYQECF